MTKLEPEEWKDLLSAAFKGEAMRLAMGLNGGVVMLGLRTSKMGKRQFSEFLEFLHATAADRGVVVYPETEEA
jgi:ABC-type Fe3+ transport system substrate-binding protein